MKINIKNKIKYRKKIAEMSDNPKDRMAFLVLLVGLAGCSVFFQYAHWNVLAKEEALEGKALVNMLPKFAPKKELMADSGLRCEIDDAGRKNFLAGKYSLDQFIVKKNIEELVGDRPMDGMVSEIATRDSKTAAYLVAIAKHESNLGKFSPKKDGRDCYNYWGFRGTYNKTASGYSCFDSPKQAVAVVGNRIQGLIENENIATPEQMLVWKCGGSCAGHNPADVERWKEDVGYYFKKITL
ncbi:MAG: hypothetical protein U0944_00245 [Candidatus Moranbacteria bacterium]|nr:hypothetical protein [Candidatus Moranbacteria bacterium]MDZ4384833.1 hypothetical protein [Candidatus Moranbacteria bacterium]